MKSKFGFIPIVLPVLVMVLIVGLINLAGPRGVQAHPDPNDNTHTTASHPEVTLTFTPLGADGAALIGGVRLSTEDTFFNSKAVVLNDVGAEPTYSGALPKLVFHADTHWVRITRGTADNVSVTIQEIEIPTADTGLRRLVASGNNQQFRIVGENAAGANTGPTTLYLQNYDKQSNNAPQFQSSDLAGERYYFQQGRQIQDNVTDYPLFPPIRSGTGNGNPTYTLVGIGVNGDQKDLPTGISFVSPTNSNRDDGWGHLEGTPSLGVNRSEDVHTLVYRVGDADDDTSAGDMSEIRFIVTIGRNPDPTPGGPGDQTDGQPGPGQPKSIEVKYTPVSESVGTTKVNADLIAEDGTKGFRRDVGDYKTTLPNDIVFAEIVVTVVTATTSVTVNSAEVATTTDGTDTVHTFTARAIGLDVENAYAIVVSSKDAKGKTVSSNYEVDIRREANGKPTFAPDERATIDLHYYERLNVDDNQLPVVRLPVAAVGSGNGSTSSWIYRLTNKTTNSRANNATNFLGLSFNGGGDAETTTPANELPNPRLSGQVRAPATSRDADISRVYAVYTVKDHDLDDSSDDMSSIDVNISVYRDVTLSDYCVGGTGVSGCTGGTVVGNLDTSTRQYDPSEDFAAQSYRYDDDDIDTYTHYVGHKLATTTFLVTKRSQTAVVSITPPGGKKVTGTSASTPRVDLNLAVGDNPVTVEVENGAVKATHVINIRRPGLTADTLIVRKFEDDIGIQYDNTAANDVKLTPTFHHEKYDYVGKVPTDVNSVRVSATPKVTGATVSVNDFKVPTSAGFRVVDLPIGKNTIKVTIEDGPSSQDYTLEITRESNTRPIFDSAQRSFKLQVNKEMATMTLPLASGGNGDLEYSINESELPPGMRFMHTTTSDGMDKVMLAGTPKLDEGYESDFDMVYTVADSDSHTGSADEDSMDFTITVTHDMVQDPSDTSTPPGQYPDGEGPATLHDIEVKYTLDLTSGAVERRARLDPTFDPQTTVYDAMVPENNTGVTVKVIPTERDAKITINNTRIDRGEKTILPPTATIRVSHGTSSMTYTLTIAEGLEGKPVFSKSQADLTIPIGKRMDPVTLPEATDGDGDIDYTLGDKQKNIIPDGLSFNENTRVLSGRPRLRDEAVRTKYLMVYTAEDEDGDTTTDEFTITICNPAQHDNCTGTTQPTNPGYTPMEQSVSRTGGSATMTWTPGDDSAKQEVVAVDMSDITGSILATFAQLEGDASRHDFSNLTAGVNYIYIVISYDAAGNYKDANGNGYWVTHTESGN